MSVRCRPIKKQIEVRDFSEESWKVRVFLLVAELMVSIICSVGGEPRATCPGFYLKRLAYP